MKLNVYYSVGVKLQHECYVFLSFSVQAHTLLILKFLVADRGGGGFNQLFLIKMLKNKAQIAR